MLAAILQRVEYNTHQRAWPAALVDVVTKACPLQRLTEKSLRLISTFWGVFDGPRVRATSKFRGGDDVLRHRFLHATGIT